MTRTFDRQATSDFFNNVYSKADLDIVTADPDAALHHRDRILIEQILPGFGNVLSVLDYGCGQGRLAVELIRLGHDAKGLEKHEGMYQVARDNIVAADGDPDRVILGSLDALRELPEASLDLFIAMGVFQYVEDSELDEIMAAARRAVKPGGHICCTFQNAFFDLFTFNKYTVDFIANDLLGPYATETEKAEIISHLESLVTNPEAPPDIETRARDNIFVRLSNPLAIGEDLNRWGFDLKKTYFYDFFGIPPLLNGKLPDVSSRIAAQFEVKNADCWEGHFMANAFLVNAQRL